MLFRSINSGGNFGIGTVSPSSALEVNNASAGATVATFEGTYSGSGDVKLASFERVGGAVAAAVTYADASTSMEFGTTTSHSLHLTTGDTARLTIDNGGNVLVGKSSVGSSNTEGHELKENGITVHTTSGTTTMYLNRKTNDGDVLEFRKDNTAVGSIGTVAGRFYIGNDDTFITFKGSADTIYPAAASGGGRDDAINLGDSGTRFKDIYASNGTIQTSDRNEKQDIEDISEAETKVAVAAKGLLKKFRWKSAVEDKGDDARIHFGIIAQDLQDAFTAEGLDAGDYGMFISSTWTDETTGEEQTRLGVRYSELLAFIIAAI